MILDYIGQALTMLKCCVQDDVDYNGLPWTFVIYKSHNVQSFLHNSFLYDSINLCEEPSVILFR